MYYDIAVAITFSDCQIFFSTVIIKISMIKKYKIKSITLVSPRVGDCQLEFDQSDNFDFHPFRFFFLIG